MPRAAFPCLSFSGGKPAVKGIDCDVCYMWARKKCSGLKPELYAFHRQSTGLQWVCPHCFRAAVNALVMARSEVVSAQRTPVAVQDDAPVTRDKARTYAEVSATKEVEMNVGDPALIKAVGLKTPNPDPKAKTSHQLKHRGVEKKPQVAESGIHRKRVQDDRAGTL
ncbi:unnamed protein product [Echinostoma caproni]|uniref:Zf-4CXXC_R1 domain-containing protein n=1 Tax=Echinostoma caproni TaxID=27848 RepID=A0A183BBT4_9TREM|nr:unnamed protein product [Echinostoma caproni]